MIIKTLEVKNSYQEFLASLSWEYNHGWKQSGEEQAFFRFNGYRTGIVYSQTFIGEE